MSDGKSGKTTVARGGLMALFRRKGYVVLFVDEYEHVGISGAKIV